MVIFKKNDVTNLQKVLPKTWESTIINKNNLTIVKFTNIGYNYSEKKLDVCIGIMNFVVQFFQVELPIYNMNFENPAYLSGV